MNSLRAVYWLVSPILYAFSMLPVLALIWLVFVPLAERLFGCPACDIGAFLGILVIGSLIFGLLSFGLTRLERLRLPGVFDHIRHSFLLYLLLLTLVIIQLVVYGELATSGLAYAFGLILFLVAGYAVLIDIFIIFIVRRRTIPPLP